MQPYLPRSDPRVLQPISQDLDRPLTYFKGNQKVEGWSEEAATYPGMNQAPSGKVFTKAHPSSWRATMRDFFYLILILIDFLNTEIL